MEIKPQECLEKVMSLRDYHGILKDIRSYDVLIKASGTSVPVKILDYVNGVPAMGPQRADKELAIEHIIVNQSGRVLFTRNESRISELVSAAIDALKQKAMKDSLAA